jgi:hypothetical protein
MAKTIGAIKDFVHFLTDDPSRRDESPQHVRTILDVLEPRSAR